MSTTAETIEIVVEHIGGPWDGMQEKRSIRKDQTSARIVQALGIPHAAPEDFKQFLHHRYNLVLRDGRALLMYRGYEASHDA